MVYWWPLELTGQRRPPWRLGSVLMADQPGAPPKGVEPMRKCANPDCNVSIPIRSKQCKACGHNQPAKPQNAVSYGWAGTATVLPTAVAGAKPPAAPATTPAFADSRKLLEDRKRSSSLASTSGAASDQRHQPRKKAAAPHRKAAAAPDALQPINEARGSVIEVPFDPMKAYVAHLDDHLVMVGQEEQLRVFAAPGFKSGDFETPQV